jgi:putative SOS response-associated peptidase YedK
MCGRFSETFDYRELKVRWNVQGDLSFAPRYSQEAPVIVRNGGRNELKSMRWGLVPSWAWPKSCPNLPATL